MNLLKLSKIKDPKFRSLICRMWITWETIQRMEQYYKEHYGKTKETNAVHQQHNRRD